jgi:hypothetical protein
VTSRDGRTLAVQRRQIWINVGVRMYSGGVILINVEGVTRDYVVDLLISRPDCGKESSLIFSLVLRALPLIYHPPAARKKHIRASTAAAVCCFFAAPRFHNKKFEKCLYCFRGARGSSSIYLFLLLPSPFCVFASEMLQCASYAAHCRARGTF